MEAFDLSACIITCTFFLFFILFGSADGKEKLLQCRRQIICTKNFIYHLAVEHHKMGNMNCINGTVRRKDGYVYKRYPCPINGLIKMSTSSRLDYWAFVMPIRL